MLILKGLVAVATLAPAVSAFFPWVPDYRCLEDKTCQTAKRGIEARIAGPVDAVPNTHSFKIIQRKPKVALLSEISLN